ncbi:hypothetical protein BVY04_03525 [bacterium M21]|nr:hypothetical protein BVY04_03525 [bacterium M21]
MGRIEVPIDPPESELILPDGRRLVRVGEERVEKLAHRASEYYVKVFVKGIFACPGDSAIPPVQEPIPDDLGHGSKLDVGLYAHFAVEKFCYHMPLNRILEKMAARDIQITRQLLSQVLIRSGDAVQPLVRLMEQRILQHGVIFTDDTPVKIQEKKKCKEGRIWVYGGGKPPDDGKDPPYLVYKFTDGRSYRHPKDFLRNFTGIFHADAFGAYEDLDQDDTEMQWLACWAHARRRHYDATSADPQFRSWILRHIRYLFMFERVAWARSPQERLKIRADKERPIVDAIFKRLKEEAINPTLLPKSKPGKAVKYMLKREANFSRYLDHASAHMDNNISERALRKIAVGRKNWLFIGSEDAGEKQMGLLSLIQTCRNLRVNPQEYLEDIFSRILTHTASKLHELLPDQWKAAGEKNDSWET